ncbi:MAG TPA: AgmX/PglI C-terminal domain-containing protein, partial [Myxococcota bacterium]|nr:AgmX/PglI C-terminal domain-containing protein [Myxococcota bacterium]
SKIPLMDGKMVERIDPRQIGLNKLLTENLGSMDAVAEVLRGDMGAMSSKLAVAMGGSGSEFVLGHGSGGMGFTGDGSGGGGDGAGRIMGMGDIDTGGGQGYNCLDRNVEAGLGDKGKKRVGNLQLSGSTSSGFCKKSNIESVVKRRAAAIRACYEQRLQVKKDLKGKISVRWTISTEGKVDGASATGDTMGDSETTNCILRTVRRMQFEKPEGGVCVVQWPFVFSPG